MKQKHSLEEMKAFVEARTRQEGHASAGDYLLALIRDAKGSIKSRIARPSNSRYLEDVRLEIEYSNDASRDWELTVRGEWTDARGEAIDGVDQTESLDDGKRFESVTITFPTLRYGLDHGTKLKLELFFTPD